MAFFIMAEGKGFEPLWLAPNGFQDRLVMTASISLRSDVTLNILAHAARGVKQFLFAAKNVTDACEKVDIRAFIH